MHDVARLQSRNKLSGVALVSYLAGAGVGVAVEPPPQPGRPPLAAVVVQQIAERPAGGPVLPLEPPPSPLTRSPLSRDTASLRDRPGGGGGRGGRD